MPLKGLPVRAISSIVLYLICHRNICEFAFLSHWTYSFVGFGCSKGLLLFSLKSCWKLSLSENIPIWWLAIINIYHSGQPLLLVFTPLHWHLHATFVPTFDQHCTSPLRTCESCTIQITYQICLTTETKRGTNRQKPRSSHTCLHTSASPLKPSLGSGPGAPRPLSPPNTFEFSCNLSKLLFLLPVTLEFPVLFHITSWAASLYLPSAPLGHLPLGYQQLAVRLKTPAGKPLQEEW